MQELPAVDSFITLRISRPHRFMSLRMVKTPEYLVSVLCWSNFYFLHNSRVSVTCCVVHRDKLAINSTSSSLRSSCHNCKSVYGLSCCSQIQFSCHSFKGEQYLNFQMQKVCQFLIFVLQNMIFMVYWINIECFLSQIAIDR